jgi:cation transport ATPase
VRQPGLPDGVADSSPIDAGGLIKERQYLGRQVAFFGDCAAYAEASAQADVAIHICRPPYREEAPSGIALLEPALEGVLALRGIAADYDARLRGSYLTALVPNAACVIGALTFGLPVLGVVALTNVGAFASYLEAGRAVRAARVP